MPRNFFTLRKAKNFWKTFNLKSMGEYHDLHLKSDRGTQRRFPPKYIEYRSDDVIKMKFVKLWDLLSYSERTTSKTPIRQKLAIRGKLSLRY